MLLSAAYRLPKMLAAMEDPQERNTILKSISRDLVRQAIAGFTQEIQFRLVNHLAGAELREVIEGYLKEQVLLEMECTLEKQITADYENRPY